MKSEYFKHALGNNLDDFAAKLQQLNADPVWQEHMACAIAGGFTTRKYEENWVFRNPDQADGISVSEEGIIKFYEHVWACGFDLPKVFLTIDQIPTFVISEAKALEIVDTLRDCYPFLKAVCDLLDSGTTLIQNVR